jgi:FkbM family methyltransferase
MMGKIVSYAQNSENVVLARALSAVSEGFYLEIGANDPNLYSVSRSFYDRGWSGLCVEPDPSFAERFRAERPRDDVLQAVISDSTDSTTTLYLIPDSGLSTIVSDLAEEHAARGFAVEPITVASFTLTDAVRNAGLIDREIHFAVIDTEGSELTVLRSIDFTLVRPWILVIEATAPLSTRKVHEAWEQRVLNAGYSFCLFDGLSRFYVDAIRHPELVESTSYPAGVFDDYISVVNASLAAKAQSAEQRARDVDEQLDAMKASRSWRFTAPLRAIGRVFRRSPRHNESDATNPTTAAD